MNDFGSKSKMRSIFTRCLLIMFLLHSTVQNEIKVSGPGLEPQKIVMPARYFFVNFTSLYGK
jgi:hypothetical protein